jgi:hypothetical protein
MEIDVLGHRYHHEGNRLELTSPGFVILHAYLFRSLGLDRGMRGDCRFGHPRKRIKSIPQRVGG